MDVGGEDKRRESSLSSMELMDADLRERDAFVKRLLKGDKEKTKKAVYALSATQVQAVSSRGSLQERKDLKRYGGVLSYQK